MLNTISGLPLTVDQEFQAGFNLQWSTCHPAATFSQHLRRIPIQFGADQGAGTQ
jgi:hypothetical protein